MVYRPWLVVLEMMQYGDLKKVMLVSSLQCTASVLRGDAVSASVGTTSQLMCLYHQKGPVGLLWVPAADRDTALPCLPRRTSRLVKART